MVFTIHHSYVNLELVLCTGIFLTELSCWRNKATLLLSWIHLCMHFTVGITIWWTVRKYPYLKWQWIFYFLRRCLLSSNTAPVLYIHVTRRVSYKKGELLTLREHLSSPPVFSGVHVAHIFSFLCCPSMCHYVQSSVLWCPLRFPHTNDVQFFFVSSCLWGLISYLRYLCLLAHSGVLHILSCVFVNCICLRLVYPILPVSLDCPFLIAPSVFYNVYLYLLTMYIEIGAHRSVNQDKTIRGHWQHWHRTNKQNKYHRFYYYHWVNTSAGGLLVYVFITITESIPMLVDY